ncbi:hypothetical protein STCU_11950 [Strigomonas culicis]|uniref:Uncharacterized protein n=1 Tax=Strigomonas culicis TaxID=28005 RepID=S9UYB8_9TRYP|nr:hypothetical protein STCU_11950 [Strigomonas culicis]|eukprot:EPY15525.1 hypothetical protein STCU_11950 [Strigomonas culicis]
MRRTKGQKEEIKNASMSTLMVYARTETAPPHTTKRFSPESLSTSGSPGRRAVRFLCLCAFGGGASPAAGGAVTVAGSFMPHSFR